MNSKQDKIFSKPLESVKDFEFNAQVVDVFDNMVSRSVPLYQQVQQSTYKVALKHLQPNSIVYDLGCATGTTLALLAENLKLPGIKLVGIDNSDSMLQACSKKLSQFKDLDLELINEDIANFVCPKASLVILNYTLQFIAPEKRQVVLNNIFQNMLPGGILILSEKVKHDSSRLEETIFQLHHDFKKDQGYSQLEISQKRDALENVLRPITTEENLQLLRIAGFNEVEIFSKWYNFVSIVALKI